MIEKMLPAFRAVIAKKLMEYHRFSQTDVARMLGTTQPAISQYNRRLRGRNGHVFLENPDLMGIVEDVTERIVSGKVEPEDTGKEFCRACRFMRENGLIPSLEP